MKAPKRKRLAKACDACHKSKRRCDGTAPCSNCYYAAKTCTYTDASGRPVPAPRPGKPDRPEIPPDARQPPFNSSPPAHFPGPSSRIPPTYPPALSTASDLTDDDRAAKRPRTDRNTPNDLQIDKLGPIIGVNVDRPAPVGLDPALTRELTNLFFTHCHPARAIIHKPTFTADLSHNRVPSYLLHAICALAAPLSKQPRVRTNPPRYAGKVFAQEALSIMFDGAGRLICEQNLATAQALCLLQMHDINTREKNTPWGDRYHDLALDIVVTLGVHSPEHPTLTPVPSPEFIQASLEREAIRRIFWLIHLLDVMASIFFKKPITFTDQDLRLRLPVDETSFELGVHSTLPEYLYLPAVRIQWASEFGHLIRILTVYAKVELALDELNGRSTSEMDPLSKPTTTLMEAEKEMEIWANSLPEHLRFSEESLQVQQSMFETSSNTGAWCWCCMHVYHASCALALNMTRHSNSLPGPPWALTILDSILGLVGDRAKNSILMGVALWSLIKYCQRDDPQVRAWSEDYEEASGTQIFDIVQEWRPQRSPPQQHPYLQLQQTSSTTLQQPLQQSHEHRRLPDVRGPVIAPLPSSGSRPPGHHGSDTSFVIRRSPSSSPNSYPIGRSLDELRLHNNGVVTSTGRVNQELPTRDARAGSNISSVGIGPGSTSTHGVSEGQKHSMYKESGVNGAISNGAAGVVNGSATHLGVSSRMDGPQVLPSLKASGLLDSWSPRMDASKQPSLLGNAGTQRTPPRKSPPHLGHDLDGRGASTLGAPVGLSWLANESR